MASHRENRFIGFALYGGLVPQRPGKQRSADAYSARRPDSKVACAEGVALADIAGLQPDFEPAHALCRRSMRERFRHDIPAGLLLHAVVADRRGGSDAGLDVTWLQLPAR